MEAESDGAVHVISVGETKFGLAHGVPPTVIDSMSPAFSAIKFVPATPRSVSEAETVSGVAVSPAVPTPMLPMDGIGTMSNDVSGEMGGSPEETESATV